MISRLVAFGDSWTYGSELRDPQLTDCTGDYDCRNDAWRLRHAWPQQLADRLGITEVINLGMAARSNDTIARQLREWLATEGYLTGRTTEQLLVCIGWTSPERRDFYFRSPDQPHNPDQGWMTLYPLWQHAYAHPALDQFSRLYIEHFWHEEEYMQRWISQLLDTQHLLNTLRASWIQFQAFYHHHQQLISQWRDDAYLARSRMPRSLQIMWQSLDSDRFMHRDDTAHTFHNHILQQGGPVLQGSHPSELGHQLWADHMACWIRERCLA